MQLQRRLLQWKLAKETLTRQIKLIHRGGNQKEVPPLMRSKKSVAFENAVNTSSAMLLQESEMLCHMNVEDLPNDGVKIVFMNPSGNETVRIPRDSQKKNW